MKENKKNNKDNYTTTVSSNTFMFFYLPENNGEVCPVCKEELYDTTPNTTYVSEYVLKSVVCLSTKCQYQGMRIV
jgi:hypothetical protein